MPMKCKKKTIDNNSECEEHEMSSSLSLQDQIWQTQLQNRQIIINGEINESIIEKAVIQIMNINQFDDEQESALKNYDRYPITVMINTHGGYIDEAFSLISIIESSKTDVHTLALGKAFSAGFLILIAGKRRYAQKYSNIMQHQGSAGISDTFSKMIEYARYWEVCQERNDKYIMARTKITKKQLNENFSHKSDWYMSPEEALKLGVIDEII